MERSASLWQDVKTKCKHAGKHTDFPFIDRHSWLHRFSFEHPKPILLRPFASALPRAVETNTDSIEVMAFWRRQAGTRTRSWFEPLRKRGQLNCHTKKAFDNRIDTNPRLKTRRAYFQSYLTAGFDLVRQIHNRVLWKDKGEHAHSPKLLHEPPSTFKRHN